MNEKITCLYHNDLDGIAAAAIVNLKYPEAKFIKVNYDSEIRKELYLNCDILIIVDFSFEPNLMKEIIKRQEYIKIIWCDHHKTAKEKFLNLWDNLELEGKRDLSFSGCELTWQYFFPGVETPDVIKLIGDRDLWKFEFDGTIPFNERMNTISENPQDIIWIMLLSNSKFTSNIIQQITSEGKILIEEKDRRVKKAFESGFDAIIYGLKAKIINTGTDVSEVGHYAVKQGYDIGFVWRQIGTKIGCSLRSKENIDVSEITKKFSGGGHKNAAGINFESYQKMLDALEKMYHGEDEKK
jgi:hypothetical protein